MAPESVALFGKLSQLLAVLCDLRFEVVLQKLLLAALVEGLGQVMVAGLFDLVFEEYDVLVLDGCSSGQRPDQGLGGLHGQLDYKMINYAGRKRKEPPQSTRKRSRKVEKIKSQALLPKSIVFEGEHLENRITSIRKQIAQLEEFTSAGGEQRLAESRHSCIERGKSKSVAKGCKRCRTLKEAIRALEELLK